MYLHLGQGMVVSTNDIIGIFDLEITSRARITRGFLESAEKEGKIINVTDELPKSFALCDGIDGAYVYISQLSASTLSKRAGSKEI